MLALPCGISHGTPSRAIKANRTLISIPLGEIRKGILGHIILISLVWFLDNV